MRDRKRLNDTLYISQQNRALPPKLRIATCSADGGLSQGSQPIKKMISIAEFKNSLGEYGKSLTEERVEQLYEWECQSGDIIPEQKLKDPDKKEELSVGLRGELEHNISKEEYRKLLNDYKSSDEQIEKRLQYLGSFCRNIIRAELQQYVEKNRKKIEP